MSLIYLNRTCTGKEQHGCPPPTAFLHGFFFIAPTFRPPPFIMSSESSGGPSTEFVPQTDLTQTIRIACDYVRDALDDLEHAAEVLDVKNVKRKQIDEAATQSEMNVEEVARHLLLVVAERLESTAERLHVTAETLQDTAHSLRATLQRD